MAGCWLLRGGGERERSEIGVPGERGGVEEGVLGILQRQHSFKLGSALRTPQRTFDIYLLARITSKLPGERSI